MRKWYKYGLILKDSDPDESIDQTYLQHASAMGGYQCDEAYQNDEMLFKKYFYGFHQGRMEKYYEFISRNVPVNNSILSIGSGRGILEYYMSKHGYASITCSDLERDECHNFLKIDFIKLNILELSAPGKYDAIICLSLIYLFDNEQLLTMFENIKKG